MTGASRTGVTCSKCHAVSPLGRVFCGNCGARLDLGGITRDTVSKPSSSAVVGAWGGKIVGVLLIVVAIAAILAFIPQTRPIGAEGSRSGSANVAALVRTANYLPRGQTVGRRISEADLNGFFYGDTLRRMKVDSFSVDITEGAVRARMIWTLTRVDVGSWRLQPKVSCEVTFVPDGNRLQFESAHQGLLPLAGPLKTAIIRQMYTRLASLPEWELTKYIADIQAHENSLDISVQRN